MDCICDNLSQPLSHVPTRVVTRRVDQFEK